METSESEVAALKEQSSLAGTEALTRILEVLADAEMRLRDAASKKILVEVSLLRAIESRHSLPIEAVLKQLNQLRGQTGAGASAPAPIPNATSPTPAPAKPFSFGSFAADEPDPTPKSAPIAKPSETMQPTPAQPRPTAAVPSPAVVASVATPADLTGLWQQLLDAIGRVSPFTRGYLIDAHPVSFLKGTLVIGFDPEFEDHLGLVDNSRNHTLLATKLAELGHPNAMIKFLKAEAPADWQRPVAAPNPQPAAVSSKAPTAPGRPGAPTTAPVAEKRPAPISLNKEEFKNDPLIQKALEVFKGTIVEVRA